MLHLHHPQTLYTKLDILRLPTEKLILRFFSDLAQRQHEEVESGKAELGTLLFSVGYLKQSSVIEVDIIQGKNLPGLDKTGESFFLKYMSFLNTQLLSSA